MDLDSPGSIQPLGRLGASNWPIPGPNNFQSQTPIPGAHLPSDMLSIGQAGMSRGPIMSQGPLGIQTILPAGLTSGKFILGYGDAHAEFEKCKRYYQNLAYSLLVQDEITIKGVLYYHASEKPIHRELEYISETVSGVPVHIGATELKLFVYRMLQPKYILWSKGFPLSVDQCELRDGAPTSKHPEIDSKNPNIDHDANSDQFFKATGRNKVKTFQAAAGRKAT